MSNEKEKRLMAAVAYLRVRDKSKSQTEIGKQLVLLTGNRRPVSQSQISRLERMAMDENYLNQHYTLGSAIPPNILKEVEAAFRAFPDLDSRVANHKPKGFHCKVEICSDVEFYREAARKLLPILQRSKLVAVSWGRTLYYTLTELARANPPRSWDFDSFPIVGHPLHVRDIDGSTAIDASSLAQLLIGVDKPTDLPAPFPPDGSSKIQVPVAKTDKHVPLLTGVASYISTKFEGQEHIRDFFNSVPGYREIFGDRGESKDLSRTEPLCERMDTLLTGVGLVGESVDGRDTATFIRERIKQEPDLTCAMLNRWVYGDISGLLLTREDISEKDHKKVKPYNNQWVGLNLGMIEKCARNASETGTPGVVVFAHQPEKAELLEFAINKGLINYLVISDSLAQSLAERLPAVPPAN